MPGEPSPSRGEVRTAEVIATLCLATDMGMGFPLEHGLQSTVVALRLAERLGVDPETATQTYYGCLLFYAGCTADAEISAELFQEGSLLEHFIPVVFGSPVQTLGGIARALADPAAPPVLRAVQGASRLPKAARGHQSHITAMCEVAQMLSDQTGAPPAVPGLFVHLTERWDGRGSARLRGDQIPLPLRIMHVARDATFQSMLGGPEYAAGVVRARGGGAFDPDIATLLANEAPAMLAVDENASVWDETLAREPGPHLVLGGEEIDRALAAMGNFADLVSPFLVGHSAGVSRLAGLAAQRCGLPATEVLAVRRAALVHDLGRVAIHAGTWAKAASLTADEWERVRLHAYHSERILSRSPFLADLCAIATRHHERIDGSGYHRGATAVSLAPAARLLAAADAYQAMTEPRPHRPALRPSQAADTLAAEADAGSLDGDSVAAVLDAAGHRVAAPARPAGLTSREAEVIGLLARGLQTKQVGRALGISAKTADHHVQNAYAKIGVSTRAAAALFAMQHGLTGWGELPMARLADGS